MKKPLVAVFAVLGLTVSAYADEQWTSGDATITYELDEGNAAVWSFDGTTIYIDGLAGVSQNRGTYSGVWMLDETPLVKDADGNTVQAEGCAFSMARPGKSNDVTNYWGQVEVTFIDADFPSVWIGYFGDCFDPLSETMIARPVGAR